MSLLHTGFISFFDGLIPSLLLLTFFSATSFFGDSWTGLFFLILLFYAIVMAFSQYFTRKSHSDLTIKTQTFENIGLSKAHERELLQEHLEEQQKWKEILTDRYNYGIKDFIITVAGYFSAGVCLYIPFYFSEKEKSFFFTCLIGCITIITGGFIKAKITSGHPFRIIGTTLLYTAILCGMVYFIINLVR